MTDRHEAVPTRSRTAAKVSAGRSTMEAASFVAELGRRLDEEAAFVAAEQVRREQEAALVLEALRFEREWARAAAFSDVQAPWPPPSSPVNQRPEVRVVPPLDPRVQRPTARATAYHAAASAAVPSARVTANRVEGQTVAVTPVADLPSGAWEVTAVRVVCRWDVSMAGPASTLGEVIARLSNRDWVHQAFGLTVTEPGVSATITAGVVTADSAVGSGPSA